MLVWWIIGAVALVVSLKILSQSTWTGAPAARGLYVVVLRVLAAVLWILAILFAIVTAVFGAASFAQRRR